ncbi:TRP-domain-containing protein [Lindgomyces ingoldianus]|uniref:TRP-domain-containing protein n=1 Tax=Lindgomyces ingoldianus TaxID=673940 RepID=A0ACB6QGB4_9PLEO|nr:TRP-domain-containing protein [Lindgomyces ingoldianus]KAF2465932.1 TRP-domain-containing protein [Lindgomyces ingoldianus]
MASSFSSRSAFALFVAILSFLGAALADNTKYVTGTVNGQQVYLKDNRRPALYTGNFGDCMGSSTVNVTRFDAAYYKDNMTVLFHLAGETALTNEALMMYIGVFAYGEGRFDLTFNPCSANIASLCPMRAGIPIEANGIIPISQSDVAGIPSLALVIPDFEGEAILRIFANSTQSEIGCFSAVVTNGNTFSQPEAVGSILGIFTIVAVIASFATAIYGDNIPVMRKHYAHSLSVLVVFAVWHHIFFSGALSMNWPSVLVAFWSNYAWAGGMIYTEAMQNSINNFVGSNKGNTSAVGAAGVGTSNENLGGGYDISKIYKRDVYNNALNVPGLMRRSKFNRVARHLEEHLAKRELANSTDGFSYYGRPVKPGLPLPGNYSGFAGTLAEENIPASNAFMTGFLWFLILMVIVAASVIALKFTLEALIKTKLVKNDRLAFFRTHYLGYTALAVLRTLFIGFFMLIFLCLFQFTYLGSTGPVAIASIVFLMMLVGLGGIAGYACFYRIKFGNYVSEPDRLNLEKRKALKFIPWYGFSRASEGARSEDKVYAGSLPWWRVRPASEEDKSIHDDEAFTKKFGWLASRFRRTRWWFFVVWLVYEFVRACFLAGASGHPMTQVFGLLVVEFIAFIGIIIMRPFEGQRLNLLVVYLLGFSKVATVALSAAFDTRFNLPRIPTTVIGIVIIVIQGILTIIVLMAIVLGAISSYMSVMRNREDFRPKKWVPYRKRYFNHIDQKEKDAPPSPPPPPPPEPEQPKGPYFSVNSIKRMPKIEDEDAEFVAEISGEPNMSQVSLASRNMAEAAEIQNRPSRAPSIRSQMSFTSLPYGARVHRASWSSRDFSDYHGHNRQRTLSSTMPLAPEPPSRPASRTLPALNARFAGSSENVNRQASPLSSRPLTPVMSPVEMGRESNNPSPLARPKSRPSVGAPRTSRPQLQTLMSENEIPSLPQMKHARDAAKPSAVT